METKEFKGRCSKLGILVDINKNKPKTPTLLVETKTYLEEYYIYKKFRDKNYSFIKEVTKGHMMEDESIYLVDRVLFDGVGLYKNTERKSDDFIEGECDVDFEDIVLDTKTCWDSKTFYKKLKEGLTKEYIWQLKGYARLYKKSKAILAYTLVNTPTYACLQAYHRGIKMDSIEFEQDYSHIPENERVLAYEVSLEDSDDKIIEDGVTRCREYLDGYQNSIKGKFGVLLK